MAKVFNVYLKQGHTLKIAASQLQINENYACFADESNNFVGVVPLDELRFISESEAQQEFGRTKVGPK